MAVRDQPYGAANFLVDLGAGVELGFSQVVLPESRLDEVEYRNGSDKGREPRTLLGHPHTTNAVLRRGVTTSVDLYDWWRQSRDGVTGVARNVVVTLLDEEGVAQLRWLLRTARPVGYGFSPLDAASDGPLLEWIELDVEQLDVEPT